MMFRRIAIINPDIVADYNSGKGGTDLFDQYISYYESNDKSKKWPIRIITHFIMVSATNSHKIQQYSKQNENNISLLKFMQK